MRSNIDQNRYQVEQATPDELYTSWLVESLKELSMHSMMLTQSYMIGEENRAAHFGMISIARELWIQLFPKIQNTNLADDFKKWMPFIVEPRLFLLDKYEGLLWLFEAHIRMAFEHLGITKLT